jgi:hypothetical protein
MHTHTHTYAHTHTHIFIYIYIYANSNIDNTDDSGDEDFNGAFNNDDVVIMTLMEMMILTTPR